MTKARRLSSRLIAATLSISLAALILAALALADLGPTDHQAKAHTGGKIALTGEVIREGKGTGRGTCETRPKVSLFEGSRRVGGFAIRECGGALLRYVDEGAGKLQVGQLKGRLRFHVEFVATGSLEHATPAKYGLGTFSNRHGSERVRISGGEIPSELGARFKLVLNTVIH